jgi:hypothetical protein
MWDFVSTAVKNIAFVDFGIVLRKTRLERIVDEAGICEYRKPYIIPRI